jgi:chorismate mutase/GNAT superfamily N-acetyltransferase
MTQNLKSLGDHLKLIDQGIMDLVLKRMQLARQVGLFKYLKGDEISRPSVENSRIAGIRQYAESIGLNPNFASSLLYSLIDESCKEQMIQLQCGKLLQENFMNLYEYGVETRITTKLGQFKAFNLAPKTLSFQDREYVFSLIYPVAQSAFGQPHSERFANDVKSHALDHAEILIVQDKDGKAIAFRIWDVFTEHSKPIIYLAGMCVVTEHQKGGLGIAMIEAAINIVEQSHKDWGYVVLRTQNWAMQKTVANIAKKSGVYKKFGDKNIDHDLQLAAKVVADKNGDSYLDPGTLVSRAIYGSSLYGSPENLQQGFIGLNVADGDAAYCVWRR